MSDATPPAEDGDDLQAAYAEIARAPYRFFWADRWWTLPHLGELDFRIQAEIEAFGSEVTLERVDELFRKIFGREQADDWVKATQPGPFLDLLFKRWLAHSGAKPGESPASKPSSKTTGRNSRPTSGGSTTSASPKRSTGKRAPRKAASPPVNSST